MDTLSAVYVTCVMFLILCFDFSKSYNDFSFQKVHLFQIEINNTAEKESNNWVEGVMVGSVSP